MRIASTCLPRRASSAAGIAWSGAILTSFSVRPSFFSVLPRVVVKGRAALGHADPPALQITNAADAGIPQLLLDDDGRQRVAGPLTALVGHDPEPFAPQH